MLNIPWVKCPGLGPEAATHWSVGGLLRHVKMLRSTRQKACVCVCSCKTCSVYLSSLTPGLFVSVQARDRLSSICLILPACFHTSLLLFPFVVRLLPYQSAVLLLLPGNDCGALPFKHRKNNQLTGEQSWVSKTDISGIVWTSLSGQQAPLFPRWKKIMWNLVKCYFLPIHLWGILCLPSFLFNNARMPLLVLSISDHISLFITRLCLMLDSDWSIMAFYGLLFLNVRQLPWITDRCYGRRSDHGVWRTMSNHIKGWCTVSRSLDYCKNNCSLPQRKALSRWFAIDQQC